MLKDLARDFLVKKYSEEARKAEDRQPRNVVNYQQVNKIGILFHLSDDVDPEPLAQFIRKLEQDHKKLKLLTYLDTTHSHPYRFYIDFFHKDDIPWTGKLEDIPKIRQFLDTPFDYLFCIESEPQPVFHSILQKSIANCRVGLYNEKRTNLFELMVQNPDWKDLTHTLEQMLSYTKQLRNET
jgi:hypothetical protein